MSACRSCGAPIVWATTARGKSMPLDPEPVDGGNVEVARDPDGKLSVIVVHSEPPIFAGALYMPHFATCPNVEEHRR